MLLQKISHDLKEAVKAGDGLLVSTLRYLLSQLHDAAIQKGKEKPLTSEEIEAEIAKEVKKHAESIEFFKKGNRADLVTKEEAEVAILKKYLPKTLSEAEINQSVTEAIAETGATSQGDMGKVMAALMPKIGNRADGSRVATVVRKLLS